ncbi:hypothetical protein PPERSA_12435 [Pseudocohnilembus persalinus]|uniref:FGFR1 oncogene partner (FOP) N-terminal dimerisation domain-containing protein n=1 Tax=Pseudocohnilembus persalinus TaxID=266149 RepID=A0A0V0QPC3_PSEPJ|nr:hypothetical protein PPERSA_12435 [Pseudocohnilembus persalinus]|eukprot:KRX03988.1 hypothetical protein PPERSA_12435 [Pseudocohnilembus persalinus]
MQELNELKNLVIQSLESQNCLSNIRAQIRASVFKVIDNQDNSQKKQSPYDWENSKCGDVLKDPQGVIVLQLIKEFFQFYKMEYSNSVFSSESSIRQEINQEELAQKVGLQQGEQNKPLLWQLLSQVLSNNENGNQQQQKQQGQQSTPGQQNQEQQQKQIQQKMEQNLTISGEFQSDKGQQQFQQDNDVQEEIEYDDEYGKKSQLKNDSQALQNSDVIGASQSQGFDMSVDSQALEQYDYFEDVNEDLV